MTPELRADPDALAVAAGRADRQAGRSRTMTRYVDAHLSRLEAFSGVLALFRDDYAAALGAVGAGLGRSADRARSLGDGFASCRSAYLSADRQAEELLRGLERASTAVGNRPEGPPTSGGRPSPTATLVGAGVAVHGRVQALAGGAREASGTATDLREYAAFLAGAR